VIAASVEPPTGCAESAAQPRFHDSREPKSWRVFPQSIGALH
jgi:hypothetical protein